MNFEEHKDKFRKSKDKKTSQMGKLQGFFIEIDSRIQRRKLEIAKTYTSSKWSKVGNIFILPIKYLLSNTFISNILFIATLIFLDEIGLIRTGISYAYWSGSDLLVNYIISLSALIINSWVNITYAYEKKNLKNPSTLEEIEERVNVKTGLILEIVRPYIEKYNIFVKKYYLVVNSVKKLIGGYYKNSYLEETLSCGEETPAYYLTADSAKESENFSTKVVLLGDDDSLSEDQKTKLELNLIKVYRWDSRYGIVSLNDLKSNDMELKKEIPEINSKLSNLLNTTQHNNYKNVSWLLEKNLISSKYGSTNLTTTKEFLENNSTTNVKSNEVITKKLDNRNSFETNSSLDKIEQFSKNNDSLLLYLITGNFTKDTYMVFPFTSNKGESSKTKINLDLVKFLFILDEIGKK